MRLEEPTVSSNVVKPDYMNGAAHSQQRKRPEITVKDLKTSNEVNQREGDQKKVQGEEQLELAVETANKFMNLSSYHLQFRIDKDSERVQVKLIDNQSKEVIREIPSKDMLELSAHIKKMIDTFNKLVGVFVDEIG